MHRDNLREQTPPFDDYSRFGSQAVTFFTIDFRLTCKQTTPAGERTALAPTIAIVVHAHDESVFNFHDALRAEGGAVFIPRAWRDRMRQG